MPCDVYFTGRSNVHKKHMEWNPIWMYATHIYEGRYELTKEAAYD
jgi:hypothetical protein